MRSRIQRKPVKALTDQELQVVLQHDRLVSDADATLRMLTVARNLLRREIKAKYQLSDNFTIDVKTGELTDQPVPGTENRS